MLDLIWETSDFRVAEDDKAGTAGYSGSPNRARAIEKYLDALVIFPAVRAAHGDPTEARQRVREALRLFCNGGKAPEGKPRPESM